MEQINSIWKEC